MSEPNNQFVKRGFWINWEHGAVMGSTITVESRTGNLVIALLTILASVASAQVWNFVTFLYHQYRATGHPSDGVYWQQQLLLRTLPTPTSLMADLLKICWAWKSRVDRPFLRSSFLLSMAILFSAAAVAAGILSNYIVTTSELQVLVDSPSCRYLNLTKLNDMANPLWANLNEAVESYTTNCYGESSAVPALCQNTFVQAALPFTKEAATCPWSPSMCLEGSQPAIAMDTGLMDVNEWLGINTPKKDTVRFRKRTTCNPVPLAGHADIRPMSDFAKITTDPPVPGEQALALRLGTLPFPADEFPEYPFISSLTGANWTNKFTGRGRVSYTSQDPVLASGSFTPLPEMQRTDADVIVDVINMNNVAYDAPVDDPVYAGHREVTYVFNGENTTKYHPDHPASIIGCTEQYQFCLERDDSCTALSALPLPFTSQDFPEASNIQLAVLQLLRTLSVINDLTNAPIQELFPANDLIARSNLAQIPSDQWVNDITFWEGYVLAGFQVMLSDAAVGPIRRDSNANTYTDPPATDGEKVLCKSMKMVKAGGFANINVFGLAFIVAFAAFFTLLNLTILRFVLFLSRFRRALAPRIDRWAQDGIFQLQRRAFDAHGEGSWYDLEKEIPVTDKRQTLSELPVDSLPSGMKKKDIALSLQRGKTWKTDVTAVSVESDMDKEGIYPVPSYESKKRGESQESSKNDAEDEICYVPQEVLEERARRNRDR